MQVQGGSFGFMLSGPLLLITATLATVARELAHAKFYPPQNLFGYKSQLSTLSLYINSLLTFLLHLDQPKAFQVYFRFFC